MGINKNPNTREHSEQAFCEGGSWDLSHGSNQTTLLAESFHKHIKIPFDSNFSILDVGCALGDAIPIWNKYYPKASIFGCDIAQSAIDRCNDRYGNIACFYRSTFFEISSMYDVIYCSNVLEHFDNYIDIARHLLSKCKHLYILTPYKETMNGLDLTLEHGCFHVATLYKNSFDSLLLYDDISIETEIYYSKGWSTSIWGDIKSFILFNLGISKDAPKRQIVYKIKRNSSGI